MSDSQRILKSLEGAPEGRDTAEIAYELGRSLSELSTPFEQIKAAGLAVSLAGTWILPSAVAALEERFTQSLGDLHNTQPAVPAHGPELVARSAQLSLGSKACRRLAERCVQRQLMDWRGDDVRLPNFAATLSPRQRRLAERLAEAIEPDGLCPRPLRELAQELAIPLPAIREGFDLAESARMVVNILTGTYVSPTALGKARDSLLDTFRDRSVTVKDAVETWHVSRKVAIGLLEYFDARGITVREADSRRIVAKS